MVLFFRTTDRAVVQLFMDEIGTSRDVMIETLVGPVLDLHCRVRQLVCD